VRDQLKDHNRATMRLNTRLGLGFGVVLVLTAFMAIGAAASLHSLMNSFRVVTDDVLPKSEIANRNIREAYDYARAFAYIVTSEGRADADAASMKAANDALRATVKAVNENVESLEKMLSTGEEKALLAEVKARRAAYGKSRNQVLEFKNAGQSDRAVALMFTETNALQTVYIDAWKKFIDHEKSLLNAGVQAAEGTFARATRALYAVLGLTMIAGLGVAFALSRWLVRALGGEPTYAAMVASRIAEGDLATDVQVSPADRTSLLFAMKVMRDKLERIVAQVRAGTDSIATATTQIATGNLDLSSRTEQQASSLQQTASSMEELTATVRRNAESAQQANRLASTASQVAVHGGNIVDEVVAKMDAINASSNKIVDIIAVIDGIAFQTNILALNAAVEAARAGEQGRGFAVVASEVRNLAQRSAAAAKEVKELIGQSVDEVTSGAQLVVEAGNTMREVVASVKRVADIIGEVTAASDHQSTGIEEVNQAVAQMDRTTQQNAALVEESAAAAGSLKAQAESLAGIVATFKLLNRAST